MELHTMNGTEKAITIEVRNRARQICQARGKRNRMPTPKERSMMRRWADEAGLTIAAYAC